VSTKAQEDIASMLEFYCGLATADRVVLHRDEALALARVVLDSDSIRRVCMSVRAGRGRPHGRAREGLPLSPKGREVKARSDYRSRIANLHGGWHSPTALHGGHCLHIVRDRAEPIADGMFSTPGLPMLWECVSCFALIADWQLSEGFIPRPCQGLFRALTPSPRTGDEK
jgi:hypothetical protein